ncbi:MAG: hypothetical protein SVY53_00045 [Chloroflexota bacterium]|nr:hypothetical protein [Chloroflexota bacterium]
MKRATSRTICILLLVSLVCVSVFIPIAVAEGNDGTACTVDMPMINKVEQQNSHSACPQSLTDEWECSESGPVSAVYFWGHSNGNLVDDINGFHLSIRQDIPVGDPCDPCSYSVPAPWTDWELDVPFEDVIVNDNGSVSADSISSTACGQCEPMSSESQFKYKILLPEEDWFWQRSGVTYWLNISACGMNDGCWGWDTAHVVQCSDDCQEQSVENANTVAHLSDPKDWEDLTAPVRGDEMNMELVTSPTPELPTALLMGLGVMGLALCIGFRRVRRGGVTLR